MTEHREQAGTGRKLDRSRRVPAADRAAGEVAWQAHVERIVNAAPPFTAGQRARLAAIFGGVASAAGRASRKAADYEDGRA